ncbi:DUF2169 domain-containing protein [Oceanihabitans sp. 2_MG-2023]|uniref:DUF2169 domain-containing protein n=1 Tax=Oceanihabitans sp. 2_MG-2023 TaxID=3062661 RepID=UPI0026E45E15|nr:DUF2169 domain-containing protein [Oceanihabitans sp. 2_MG-2023]MDO6597312.1 DUF2169 domain-containing protein [Oceanihabitans sp. 2_MG-2023]
MKETIQLISGNNVSGKPILSLIVKRTYIILNNGTCIYNEVQKPITKEHTFYDDNEKHIDQDIDLYTYKPLTDVIVKGKARTNKKTNSFQACVEIARLKLDITIFGNRNLYKANNGIPTFTTPENILEVPLTYNFAYGGKDLLAERHLKERIENDTKLKYLNEVTDLLAGSPYRYQRNPEGKGYITSLNEEGLEKVELPNLENPYQLVTPENIVCKSIAHWQKMPLPVATDFVHPGWFPRVAYFGMYPIPKGFDEDAYEITKKLVDEEILKSRFEIKKAHFNFRAFNSASLGLQSRYLHGGESCRLTNIHPNKTEFVFKLPNEQPKIKIDNRKGKLIKADVNMHSVIIEPDTNSLSIVWCGTIKALRPYMEEELEKMPFEVKWN